jgi:hypothetical protein
MTKQFDIGKIGENLVAHSLSNSGYITNVDTKLPGSTDIEAASDEANLLVQVKTAFLPNKPTSLTSEESRNIKSKAARIGYQAWEAKVQLDVNHRLVGDIQWRQLK